MSDNTHFFFMEITQCTEIETKLWSQLTLETKFVSNISECLILRKILLDFFANYLGAVILLAIRTFSKEKKNPIDLLHHDNLNSPVYVF